MFSCQFEMVNLQCHWGGKKEVFQVWFPIKNGQRFKVRENRIFKRLILHVFVDIFAHNEFFKCQRKFVLNNYLIFKLKLLLYTRALHYLIWQP